MKKMYSHIDTCSYVFGSGGYAYIMSTNYLMEQPSPRDVASNTQYTASIEVGEVTKVSGSYIASTPLAVTVYY